MYSALILLAEATSTPNPEPTLRPGLDPDNVTPGAEGFFVTAAVVIIAILLMVDMVRRVRRIRYREMAEQKLLAEQQEKDDASDASAPESALEDGTLEDGVPDMKHDGDASPNPDSSPEIGAPPRT